MKGIIEYMSEEDYKRYNEILEIAHANKSTSVRVARGPMTIEQKTKMAQARLAKAQAALDALLAAENV